MAVLSEASLEYPFTAQRVAELGLGQMVRLAGRLFACRDRVHKFLAEGGAPPVALADGAIYHCGPAVVRREGVWVVRAAGPTTSARHEPYMAEIIRKLKVRVIVGKGGMGARTRAACAECGCVYLQAIGGAAQLLAARIEQVEAVHLLEEFGPTEALWVLAVRDFPALVTMDARGRSLYERVARRSRRALQRLVREQAAFKG